MSENVCWGREKKDGLSKKQRRQGKKLKLNTKSIGMRGRKTRRRQKKEKQGGKAKPVKKGENAVTHSHGHKKRYLGDINAWKKGKVLEQLGEEEVLRNSTRRRKS